MKRLFTTIEKKFQVQLLVSVIIPAMLMLLTAIYVSTLPIIFAATLSTIVVKRKVFDNWRLPIDNGKIVWDGRPIFGDNKTWLGVAGLVVFGAIAMGLWGYVCSQNPSLAGNNWFYRSHANSFSFNIASGALLGLAYAVAELPNSFIKRRQGIDAGKMVGGLRGMPNTIVDHTDSILGCGLVLLFLCPLSIGEFFGLVIIGALTHIAVNEILVITNVKQNL